MVMRLVDFPHPVRTECPDLLSLFLHRGSMAVGGLPFAGGDATDLTLCAAELLTNVTFHVGEGTPVTLRLSGAHTGRVRSGQDYSPQSSSRSKPLHRPFKLLSH